MTPMYRTAVAALKTVGGLTVIKGSWLSAQKDWPLPAVIVDMENPIFDAVTEDGALEEVGTRISLLFHVKQDDTDPEGVLDKLEQYFGAGIEAIGAAFPTKQMRIDLPQVDTMQFGKTQIAPGIGFFLTISDGE